MTAFYVIKSNGSIESKVVSGVFGTAEPMADRPGHMLFHADPSLERCSTSLSLTAGGRGAPIAESELIRIEVAPEIANAMKANLAITLKNRWSSLYDQVMGRTSSAVRAMAQVEKDRALGGIDDYLRRLPGIGKFDVGVQFNSVDVREGYDGRTTHLNGQMTPTESLAYRLPEESQPQLTQENEEMVPGIYKATAYVPMFLPLGGNVISRLLNSSQDAQAERIEVMAPQLEEMMRISVYSELAELIIPQPTPDMIDWSTAQLIEAHPEQDDQDYDEDDYYDDYDDEYEENTSQAYLSYQRPSL